MSVESPILVKMQVLAIGNYAEERLAVLSKYEVIGIGAIQELCSIETDKSTA